MLIDKIYQKEEFFKFLVALEEIIEKKERVFFCQSIGITEEVFLEFVDFFKRFGLTVNFDEIFIYALKDKLFVNLKLNISEWLALQVHTDLMKRENRDINVYARKLIQNKIDEVNLAHSQFDIFRMMGRDDAGMVTESISNHNEDEKKIKLIDEFISNRRPSKIYFSKDKSCEAFLFRMVFLDSVLCVIAEEMIGKNLIYFAFEDIKSLVEIKSDYSPHISQLEVNEFIGNIRLIVGNEERLVLKIFSPNEEDMFPKNHFLGNPFITNNSDGDLIWAASIEMCEDVYRWLYQMKDKVEVLDPGHIRREFAHYCELKKLKIEVKKAS